MTKPRLCRSNFFSHSLLCQCYPDNLGLLWLAKTKLCTQMKGSNNKVKKNEKDVVVVFDTAMGCGYIVRRWKRNNLKMAIALSEIKRKYTFFCPSIRPKIRAIHFFLLSSALLPFQKIVFVFIVCGAKSVTVLSK